MLMSVSAFAQNAGGGGAGGGGAAGGGGGGRQRGGGNNPGGGGPGGGQDWRQQYQDRLKEQLGATDDEFKALQPKIEKVQNLQRQNMAARFGGMGFGRRGGGPGGNNPQGGPQTNNPGAPGGDQPAAQANPVADASNALRTTLDNKDATAADIKAKLDALRAAKAKNHEELLAAQKELKELLSQRQEAVMVQMGVLD
jgi:hypothetical protein